MSSRTLRSSLLVWSLLTVPAVAQCDPATALTNNWILPFEDQIDFGNDLRSVVVSNPYSYPIEICDVRFYLSTNCVTSRDLPVTIRQVDRSGAPGSLWASGGLVTALRGGGVVRTTFPNPPTLQPGERYHVIVDYDGNQGCNGFGGGIKRSVSTTGNVVESWAFSNLLGWHRDDERMMYQITHRPSVLARYVSYGAGCAGSAPCSNQAFRDFNWTTPVSSMTLRSGRWAIRVRDEFGYPTRDVCGIEWRTSASTSSAATLPVWIYSERNGRPDQILTSSNVTLRTGAPSLHRVDFASPARIQAGTNYWIAFEPSFPMVAPAAQFGSPITHALDNGNGWSLSNQYSWSFRTYVTTAPRQVPRLTGSRPILGTTVTLRLEQAEPQAPALLLFGLANPDLDLAPLGAPGCRALATADLLLPALTNGNGEASIALPIPNDSNLLSQILHNQWITLSPVNTLGVIVSNGAEATLGSR